MRTDSPKIKFALRTLAAATLALCLASLGEWAVRSWIRARGDGLARAHLVLEPDAELGWRQRPNLDTSFEGQELHTNSIGLRGRENYTPHPKVLVLGPSSTFGWGVTELESYPGQLQAALARAGGASVVINAGEIGFSLVQGRRLYEMLRARWGGPVAQTVVLAYGVNDLDRQRFFGRNGPTDRELFGEKQGPNSLAFARALNAFALSGLFARAWEESDIYRRCGLSENPRLRVPIEEFGPELNSFVERIRADGSTPILLNTAFFNRRPVAAGDAERSDSLYRESAAASAQGRCADSRRLFFAARQFEPARLERDVRRLNAVVQEVSAATKAKLVDLTWLERGASPRTNFVDAVHPSAAANQRIGEILARLIESGPR